MFVSPAVDNNGQPITISEAEAFNESLMRKWFAGLALSSLAEIHNGIGVDPKGVAIAAYQFADAMISASKATA